jgi:hypothetical protein
MDRATSRYCTFPLRFAEARSLLRAVTVAASFSLTACGSPGTVGSGTGGQSGHEGLGGSGTLGGATGSGGLVGSGGSIGSGGLSPGGTTGTGGFADTGGAGGSSSGDATGTGGASGGMTGQGGSSGGSTGTGGMGALAGPCDIFASGSTPCVAAHSIVRALYGSYSGNLYQVRRASDETTKDVGVLSPGGFADAATQDSFCSGTSCTISIIYDQSGRANNLTVAPAGGYVKTPDKEADATALKLTVSGHTVYGVHLPSGVGYRIDKTSGIATGDQAETAYMVTGGTYVNGGCCFDYGNAEMDNSNDGSGTMEAIYFGTCTYWAHGSGNGPWVMADLENGLWAGSTKGVTNSNTPLPDTYVTALLRGNSGNSFVLKGGNAKMSTLTTMWNGARPSGYSPMRKKGAIILGIGGDNSNGAQGNFFEGALTTGSSTDATDAALQANIVAAGYGD